MKRNKKAKYFLAGAVALLTFAVYLPALQNGFVEWDDNLYVYENPHIRSFDIDLFRWAFSTFHAANWHPLTWISHALDYAVWGLDPMGHHLTSIILHAVNTFIVVLLVVRLWEAASLLNSPHPPLKLRGGCPESFREGVIPPGAGDSQFTTHDSRLALIAAGTTGLLFGLHPVHVESVAWVAERKDLLCALFYLLSVMMYVKYVCRGGPMWPPKEGQPQGVAPTKKDPGSPNIGDMQEGITTRGRGFSDRQYLLSLSFFVLALLSKPMAVSLPLVLLILDWYPFERIRTFTMFRIAFIEKLPFIVLSIVSSVLTILAQKAGGAMTMTEYVPFPTRILVATKSLVAYAWKMILPLNLIPYYPYPNNVSFLSLEYLAAIALVAVLTTACIVIAIRQKSWPAVWGYYVVTLIPVLGIIQVGGQSMADRYTYLPSLGPFLIVGLIITEIYEKGTALRQWRLISRIVGIVTTITVLVSMSFLTVQQIGIWKNGLALWDYVIEKEPLKVPHAYTNRGFILLGRGLIDEATEHFHIAIRLNPGNADAYNNLCLAYKSKGLYEKAIEQCRTAITLRPDYAEAHNNLGVVYKYEGMYDKAVEQYRIALRLKPDYAEALFNLGIMYKEKGDMEMARGAFEEGLKIKPDDYKARQVLDSINSK